MIYWKEEAKRLAAINARVVVVDRYDEKGIPVFAVRQVLAAVGSRSGKNSYWSVQFAELLSDDCNAVTFAFILAYNDGETINTKKLLEYRPSWCLNVDDEQELVDRKYKAMCAVGHQPADAVFVKTHRVYEREYLNEPV